jgi:hypothetical protein
MLLLLLGGIPCTGVQRYTVHQNRFVGTHLLCLPFETADNFELPYGKKDL